MPGGPIDERMLAGERIGASFLVFFYAGDERPDTSWAVDSHLLTDVDLPAVLEWVRDHVPAGACWSLGVVTSPTHPTTETEIEVRWIIGADVLNMSPDQRTDEEERLARQMLDRRGRVDLIR